MDRFPFISTDGGLDLIEPPIEEPKGTSEEKQDGVF